MLSYRDVEELLAERGLLVGELSSSARRHPNAFHEVVQELRSRIDAGDQQMIPSARASDVQEVQQRNDPSLGFSKLRR